MEGEINRGIEEKTKRSTTETTEDTERKRR
jgi:hypothetical protein